MSGHSKWAKIKRSKGASDQKRGALFSKLAKEISVCAKDGGNPDANIRLRTAIQRAKAASMPGDSIEKAILRGTGQLPGMVFEEVTYEGYAPGGVAVVVECLTDSRNRTTASLRNIFSKGGGNLAASGAVAFQFERKGVITVPAGRYPEDMLLEKALEAGADDVEQDGDSFEIRTDATRLHAIAEALKKAGIEYESAEIVMLPNSYVSPDLAVARSVMKLVATIEDDDDVQNVYHNCELTPELLKELADE